MTQQHKPTLLEQARLTDAERGKIWRDVGADVLMESRTTESVRDVWARLVLFQDASADAATRKAFEVLEAWLRAEAERLQEKRLSYSGLLAVIATLRAQLQAQTEAQP